MEKPLLNSQILRRIHGLAQQLKVYIYVILLMGQTFGYRLCMKSGR